MCESGEDEEGNLDHMQITRRAGIVHPDKKEQQGGKDMTSDMGLIYTLQRDTLTLDNI